jgi:ribosomal protein S18 acetylase RimI-like enzyme
MSQEGPGQIVVREALASEHEEAGRITAEAYREFVGPTDHARHEYLEAIADVGGRADRTTILVALDGERIVGSATLELVSRVEPDDDPELQPEEAHIRMLGVQPGARRRGVARALMEACFAHAGRAGKEFMTLHTTERMRDAQAMYESMGFERLDDRVFPDGFVLLTYRRSL